MGTIDRLLATGNLFQVDPSACMLHAEILRQFEGEHIENQWANNTKQDQLIFKVAFISICHQFNWDFLQNALAENLLDKQENIATILCRVTASDISEWLSDYPKKDRIRAKERARLLRDVGRVLENKFQLDGKLFLSTCANSRLNDFRIMMDFFEGYRTDRMRKKTNVLSHDLVRENIVEFSDLENLEPAIDYHIMRVYVRSGRVVPTDPAIFRFLEGAPNPRGTLVRALRRSTSEAVKLTAYYAGINVADLNFIEWQVGREICHNIEPDCDSVASVNPILVSVSRLSESKCPYRDVCLSKNQLPEFIKFEEPDYISTDY